MRQAAYYLPWRLESVTAYNFGDKRRTKRLYLPLPAIGLLSIVFLHVFEIISYKSFRSFHCLEFVTGCFDQLIETSGNNPSAIDFGYDGE
jgi:hypothetical protein